MDSDDRRERTLAWRRKIPEVAPPDRPALIAVAEVQVDQAPWPLLESKKRHEIRLRPGLSPAELGTLVASSIYYGDDPPPAEDLFTANLRVDYAILIGGVYSIGADGTVIHPGCCIGLEDWREWPRALDRITPVTFGHGPPEAWMNVTPDGVTIEQAEPDWDMYRAGAGEPPIALRVFFTWDQYAGEMARLTDEIASFGFQVLDWATTISPDVGPIWAEHWLGNLDMLPGSVRE